MNRKKVWLTRLVTVMVLVAALALQGAVGVVMAQGDDDLSRGPIPTVRIVDEDGGRLGRADLTVTRRGRLFIELGAEGFDPRTQAIAIVPAATCTGLTFELEGDPILDLTGAEFSQDPADISREGLDTGNLLDDETITDDGEGLFDDRDVTGAEGEFGDDDEGLFEGGEDPGASAEDTDGDDEAETPFVGSGDDDELFEEDLDIAESYIADEAETGALGLFEDAEELGQGVTEYYTVLRDFDRDELFGSEGSALAVFRSDRLTSPIVGCGVIADAADTEDVGEDLTGSDELFAEGEFGDDDEGLFEGGEDPGASAEDTDGDDEAETPFVGSGDDDEFVEQDAELGIVGDDEDENGFPFYDANAGEEDGAALGDGGDDIDDSLFGDEGDDAGFPFFDAGSPEESDDDLFEIGDE